MTAFGAIAFFSWVLAVEQTEAAEAVVASPTATPTPVPGKVQFTDFHFFKRGDKPASS